MPDPDDRHVVAAALASGADVVVTWNRKDFPTRALQKLGLQVSNPDAFLLAVVRTDPSAVVTTLAAHRQRLRAPPLDPPAHLTRLRRAGLARFAKALRPHIAAL